ncbi:protein kinase domain-containing protein [Streptomyces xiamenensis]
MTTHHTRTAGRLLPLLSTDPERLGPWRLLARLGAGGMGTVYLARSPQGRTAALKAVHPAHAARPQARERFRSEVRAMRDLQGSAPGSRRFAAVIDADTESERPWLATAYVPAPTLREAVEQHGRWPLPAVRILGAELADALLTVHRAGLVHRDIKPSNVLAALDGPRLIDFGISVFAGEQRHTDTGQALGSPGYLAPEQAEGGPATPAGDVFALAGVLVFAATGSGPFGEGRPEELIFRARHEAPRLDGIDDDAVRSLLARCLAPAAEGRPTAGELGRELSGGPGAMTFADCLPPPVLTDIGLRATHDALLPRPLRVEENATVVPDGGGGPSRRSVLLGAAGVLGVSAGSTAVAYAAGRLTRGTGETAAGAGPGAPSPSPSSADSKWAAPAPLWTHRGRLDTWGRPVPAEGTLVTAPGIFSREMYGLATDDGSVRWTVTDVGGDQPVVTPDGETVIVQRLPGAGGGLGLVDARTGSTRVSTDLDINTFFMNRTPVVAVSGRTVCVVGHDPDAADKDEARLRPQPVVAYDLDSDSVLWRAEVPMISEGWVEGVAAGGHFILLGWDRVHAFAVSDGRLGWERDLGAGLVDHMAGGDRFYSEPPDRRITALPDDSVLIAGRGLLHLDAATGDSRWSLVPDEDPDLAEAAERYGYAHRARYGTPCVVGETVYLNQMGAVHAIDLTTYGTRWSWVPESDRERMEPPPAGPVSAGGLVFPTISGALTLVALDGETGELRWQLMESDGYSSEVSAVVAENRLYVHVGDTIRALPL